MAKPELPSSAEQVGRLIELLRERPRALILTHDNPDPDSIAAAYCLSHLLEVVCSLNSRILYGGIIGRSVNRQMVNALKIPMLPFEAARLEPEDGLIVVDTQPSFTNNSLPGGMRPLAVIDHHPPGAPGAPGDGTDADLVDLRPHYGAVTTIATEYLVSTGVTLTSLLATAICFGISTETQDLGREACPADVAAFLEAFPESDQPLLGRLRHPQRSAEFFRRFDLALHAARLYGPVAICHIDGIDVGDTVAEVADVLVEIEDIEWVLCTGAYEGNLVMSLRTTDREANAGELLRNAVGETTRAGGHGMIAGGAVPLEGREPRLVHEELIERFLRLLGHEGAQPERLVEPHAVLNEIRRTNGGQP